MRYKTTLLFLLCFIHLVAVEGIKVLELDGDQRISAAHAFTPPPGSHPFAVSITLNDVHICGGFVYNQNFIVTTAYCVYGKSAGEVHAIIGERTINITDPGEQRMQIRDIIIHENYDSLKQLNDIALLETSKGIVFSEHVSPAYLNGVQLDPDSTTYTLVFGWGATGPDGPPSTKLLYGILPIRSECREFPLDEEYFPNQMFCAGRAPYDIDPNTANTTLCQYDEGSPGMQLITSSEYYVVGLASKHLTCGRNTVTNSTIFTRLSAYYPWLNRNAGTQPPMPPTTSSTTTTTTTLPTTDLPITPLSVDTDSMYNDFDLPDY